MPLDVPAKLSNKFEQSNEKPAQYLVVMSEIPLGIFTMNGDITDWHSLNPRLDQHLSRSRYSDAPAIIYNLHPEHSFIGGLLDYHTKRDYIGSGDEKGLQCLSNIRLIRIDDNVKKIFDRVPTPLDVIQGDLSNFTSEKGVLSGKYVGPVSMKGFSDLEDGKFRQVWLGLGERFSGQRRKLPLSLSNDGVLELSESGKPFTHIGKFPQIGGAESMAVTEFMGLSAAKVAGLRVSDFALVSQGQDLPPMFVIQRFDIAANEDVASKQITVMQDFYSLNGEDPARAKNFHNSYENFMGQWRHQLRELPEVRKLEEMKEAFTSLLVAYVVNDGDKHAKNFSTLKKVCKENCEQQDLSFAPTYDTVCDVVTGRDGSEMFFKLRDKDNARRKTYHMDDWLNFLKTDSMKVGDREYGLFATKKEAEAYIVDTAYKAAQAVVNIQKNPPEVCLNNAFSHLMAHDMKVATAVAVSRAEGLGAKNLDIDFDVNSVWKDNKKIGAKQRETSVNRNSSLRAFLSQFNINVSEPAQGADFNIAAE